MTVTFSQQMQVVESITTMQEKAMELQIATKACYDEVTRLASRLADINDPISFQKAYEEYRAKLAEADVLADATRLTYNMSDAALKTILGEADPTFH